MYDNRCWMLLYRSPNLVHDIQKNATLLPSNNYSEQVSNRLINYNVVGKYNFFRDAEALAFIYCLIYITHLFETQSVHMFIF